MAKTLYADGKRVDFIKVPGYARKAAYRVNYNGRDWGEVWRGSAPSGYWGHWRYGANGGAATRQEAALRLLREKGLIT